MVINWPARPAADPGQDLENDKLELKAQIRTALADLAARHGIAQGEVDHVMWAYIDQAVGDLTFAHERGVAPAGEADTRSGAVLAFARQRPVN